MEVMEMDIWLPAQIVVSPIGWRSAMINVAKFLPMTEGQVTCPLCVWKASSNGQFFYFSVACLREALAVVPSAPSSFKIWDHDLIADLQ
jgi:hypothetical protein